MFYSAYFILQPYAISPLKLIPGPWYAVYIEWWLVWKTMMNYDLYLEHDSWVRILPNEISICDPEAIASIYGVNAAYVKTEFYTYQLRGVPKLFTMSDRKQHARRRRKLSRLFSMSTITEYTERL